MTRTPGNIETASVREVAYMGAVDNSVAVCREILANAIYYVPDGVMPQVDMDKVLAHIRAARDELHSALVLINRTLRPAEPR